MLTANDLEKIRQVIREEVSNETQAMKDDLQSGITMSQLRIRNEISGLQDRIKNLEIRVTKMHKDLKNDIKFVANMLDKDNMSTLKRVKALEQHVGVPS